MGEPKTSAEIWEAFDADEREAERVFEEATVEPRRIRQAAEDKAAEVFWISTEKADNARWVALVAARDLRDRRLTGLVKDARRG